MKILRVRHLLRDLSDMGVDLFEALLDGCFPYRRVEEVDAAVGEFDTVDRHRCGR